MRVEILEEAALFVPDTSESGGCGLDCGYRQTYVLLIKGGYALLSAFAEVWCLAGRLQLQLTQTL